MVNYKKNSPVPAQADNIEEPGLDSFMDFAAEDDAGIIPPEESNPDVRFMQQGINALAKATGKPQLKEDGILGPKSRMGAANMLRNLPPQFKSWAVNRIHKEMNKDKKKV